MFGRKRGDIKKVGKVRSGAIKQTASPYLSKGVFGKKKRKKIGKEDFSRRRVFRSGGMVEKAGGKKVNWGVVLGVFFLFLVLGLGIWVVFGTEFFLIKDYKIYEESEIVVEFPDLENLVRNNLRGQKIWFDEMPLAREILSGYPEYELVTINKFWPDRVEVKLFEYSILANFTAQVRSDDGPVIQKKFLMNTQGLLVAENDENPELPTLVMEVSKMPNLKDKPLKFESVVYAIQAINLFEEKFGMEVWEARIYEKDREVHLRTEKQFLVWMDLVKPVLEQINKLKVAASKLDIYRTELEYIDLRISGVDSEKVIFKPRKK